MIERRMILFVLQIEGRCVLGRREVHNRGENNHGVAVFRRFGIGTSSSCWPVIDVSAACILASWAASFAACFR